MSNTLFDPIDLGSIKAPNRILMAPLTRTRSTDGHVPTGIMIDYYRQRAGAERQRQILGLLQRAVAEGDLSAHISFQSVK